MKYVTVIFSVLMVCSLSSYGKVRLPAVFADGMVLQQQRTVSIWGKATAHHKVTLQTSWDHRSYETTADAGGDWRLPVKTPVAGGPFTIRITEGVSIELTDILVGEVWLCSGQSNMEMPMTGYHNQPVWDANDALATATNARLRLFHIPHAVSLQPQTEGQGKWERAGPATAAGFSAVGYRFAKRLQEIMDVPVGIIQATWGGTPIEAWMDLESLQPVSRQVVALPAADARPDRLLPTCLYNGMIEPVAGYGIKGFLWYQGEANVGRPSAYKELMQRMVAGWRKRWRNEDLYFYYVQIAPWHYGKRKDSTAYLREAQTLAARKIPKSGMVVSIDKGSATTVHPPDKKAISDRLLYWALGDAYQIPGISFRSPEWKGLRISKDTAMLSFENAPQGLYATDGPIEGFEMAGRDRKFYPATARIYKSNVMVQSEQVKEPVAVRYAFTDMVTGNLYSSAGIPVGPFRTDDWK